MGRLWATVSLVALNFSVLASAAFLEVLPTEEHSSFTHASFPAHRLRIKKATGFCDPTVNVYTGWLDASYNTKHLFFWFFESRRDPARDDVLMWINGGPGGSSAMGAFMELGPCSISSQSSNRTVWNPYSWNSHANVFFLDQPVGVGFSYADYGQRVQTTPDAARDIQAFVSLFFETFSEYKGRAFHMAGESYGGRYIPLFASAIYDGNRLALAQGHTPINLQSVLIGNGFTSQYRSYSSFYEMQCTSASGNSPVQPIDTCIKMKRTISLCDEMKNHCDPSSYDRLRCEAANSFCRSSLMDPWSAISGNIYDMRRRCKDGDDVTCYDEPRMIEDWLNLPSIRDLIGVPFSIVPNYSSIAFDVNSEFHQAGDDQMASHLWIGQLLERGVRTLIYAGETDLICNWLSNFDWTQSLDWSGHKSYEPIPLQPWYLRTPSKTDSTSVVFGSVPAGKVKSWGPLTFLTIAQAGHMAPFDKPAEGLDMLDRWLEKSGF